MMENGKMAINMEMENKLILMEILMMENLKMIKDTEK